jgi:ribosomal protein S18 acetylase RimI-like enzyme
MKETFEQGNKFKINSILPSEWESYKELWLDALTSDPQAFGYSLDEISNRTEEDWKKNIQKSLQENTGMHIAKSDNKYIGMMGYFPKNEDTVNIFGVYVKKEFRNQGVSDKIMESVLTSLAKNDKIKNIALTVSEEQKAAIEFYTRFGFEIVDKIKDVKMGNGEMHDELAMKKRN